MLLSRATPTRLSLPPPTRSLWNERSNSKVLIDPLRPPSPLFFFLLTKEEPNRTQPLLLLQPILLSFHTKIGYSIASPHKLSPRWSAPDLLLLKKYREKKKKTPFSLASCTPADHMSLKMLKMKRNQ